MLRLTRAIYMEMVAHCLSGLPDEACGLLVGAYGKEDATHLFPTANAAASAMVYEIDPRDMLKIDRQAQSLGADIMGVFHSHTHTDAYPSPTDVRQATDPGWHYVLVSLRDTHPVVRSYGIVDGQITEEAVEVPGLGLDVAGATAQAAPTTEAPAAAAGTEDAATGAAPVTAATHSSRST